MTKLPLKKIPTRALYMNDSHIRREAKEERFENCTFLTVDFTDFDCENAFFERCLFLNCLLPKIMHTLTYMSKCAIVGGRPDKEMPSA